MRHPLGLSAGLLVACASGLGAQAHEPGVQAHLFADFNYSDTQRPSPDGFRLGQVAGHVAWGLSDRVTFFSEATLAGSATGYAAEVERALLRYDVRNWLRLSAGRVHTPIGYWNNAFHHGQWMQTTIGRPEMVRGGNALVPLHFVGVTAEGTAHAGPATLGYTLGVGNGRGATITRGGDAGDANNSRAVVGAVFARHAPLGVRVGASYYGDRLTPSAAFDVRERTVAAHAVLERESPELIAEYARVRHDARRPARAPATSATYYVQAGYRLPGRASAWKPYARLDRSDIARGDTILAPLRLNFDGLTGGVRYDALGNAAVKLEYRGERIERGPRLRTLALSVSFMLSGRAGGGHDAPPVADDHAAHAAPADSAGGTRR
jgi:opacity protein-like surface antigen